jgi:hypothetical protein
MARRRLDCYWLHGGYHPPDLYRLAWFGGDPMRSKIGGLKNRPYVRPNVAVAFSAWSLLTVEMKQNGLYPEAHVEVRVFLSWLFDECDGDIADLEWLESVGIISDDQIIDWETSA